MRYVIVQRELATPDVDKLCNAFRVWPQLTGLDAQTVVRDAFGILLRGLELEPASALQDALMKEGIDVEVVEESELPMVPPPKMVRQVDFLPSQLTLYDPMKRAFTLAWQDIMLIAAGHVRLQDFRKRGMRDQRQSVGSVSVDTTGEVRLKEQPPSHLMLELVLAGGVSRYSIIADEFDFSCLGSRMSKDLASNFRFLVQDISQAAPDASLNRGAFRICEKGSNAFEYPSKQAFFEEMVWMLWRIARAQAES